MPPPVTRKRSSVALLTAERALPSASESPMDMKNRVALVRGASRGLGAAVARVLGRMGWAKDVGKTVE